MMQVLIWLTPAGTVDDGGKEQPAYLNFDVSLLGPPSGNHMEVGGHPTSIFRRVMFFVHNQPHKTCRSAFVGSWLPTGSCSMQSAGPSADAEL